MDDSSRLKMFLDRLGRTYLMCDEKGIRNFVYAPEVSMSSIQFPSELLYSDSDDNEDDEPAAVSEERAQGVAQSEDSRANAVNGVEHDRPAEEAAGGEGKTRDGAHDEWEEEAAGPLLGADNSDGKRERNGAGEDKDDQERCLLSLQLEQCTLSAGNTFGAYGQYEGTSRSEAETKTFRVFLSMLSPPEWTSPLHVCVIKSATFSDLVGLALFKYVSENPNSSVRLKDDVREYGVCVAGEEGEVGSELSLLDPGQMIGDFPYINLAVVESPGKETEQEEERAPTPPGDRARLSEA